MVALVSFPAKVRMVKTERLAVKILASDKAELERKARAEGEPMAVIVRRAIRRELAAEPVPQLGKAGEHVTVMA